MQSEVRQGARASKYLTVLPDGYDPEVAISPGQSCSTALEPIWRTWPD